MGFKMSSGQSQTVGAEVGSVVGAAVVGAVVGSLVVGAEDAVVEFEVEFVVGAGDTVGAGPGDTVEFVVSVAFVRVI